jgi:hypothetical protein
LVEGKTAVLTEASKLKRDGSWVHLEGNLRARAVVQSYEEQSLPL